MQKCKHIGNLGLLSRLEEKHYKNLQKLPFWQRAHSYCLFLAVGEVPFFKLLKLPALQPASETFTAEERHQQQQVVVVSSAQHLCTTTHVCRQFSQQLVLARTCTDVIRGPSS
jgi:hypothetical protein